MFSPRASPTWGFADLREVTLHKTAVVSSKADMLLARAIAIKGSLTQQLPNTWQIAALYALLAI